jgi:diphosphomevalonate decarboxylase
LKDVVTSRAYANIALVKYWGKRLDGNNAPATPSISLGLESLRTETTIERISEKSDIIELDGKLADNKTTDRIINYLDWWRSNDLIDGTFKVSSQNWFPTAAGLASSASGFAALATALSGFANKKISRLELSKLARIGSGSAARSIPGGISAMVTNSDPSARKIIDSSEIPWGMVVAVVDAPSKEIGSTEGMILSQETSPYYNAWLKTAREDYKAMLPAIKELDLEKVGKIAEANALAMHACMSATRPSLVYWSEATITLLRKVKEWRQQGIKVYATIDAGPHVCLLANLSDLAEIAEKVNEIQGVKEVFSSKPAPSSSIIS